MSVDGIPRRIIGVVGNTGLRPLSRTPTPQVYFPLTQAARIPGALSSLEVAVRGVAGMPRADHVRSRIATVDPGLIMASSITAGERLSALTAPLRFYAAAAVVLAAAATGVAVIGVFGLLSFSARQRMREFAVRLAVGATPQQITLLMVRQGGSFAIVGVALGISGAVASSGLIRNLLFEIRENDPAILATTAAIVLAVAAAAVYLPARLASESDPAELLRSR